MADRALAYGAARPDWPKAATKIYNAVQIALTGRPLPAEALRQAQGEQ
ncbi:hypothetical protein GCM10020220_040470 [Nonomuraea rubra]